MAGHCTVDAELFETLQEAIDFVAAHGGGAVHTELAGTPYAARLKLPEGVRLEPARPAAAAAAATAA
ncbi:MAG TPA: hypothetical protein VFG47_07795 [Geminicoccaceae bacterium]|nr:hypothetical protein [Geminicoccaceae bacterium]